jgi:hypothetical protein
MVSCTLAATIQRTLYVNFAFARCLRWAVQDAESMVANFSLQVAPQGRKRRS